MFTYKIRFTNILQTLKLLANPQACFDGWVNGVGYNTAGWKESLNDLGGECFFDLFPEEIDLYLISPSLKESILSLCRKLDNFYRRIPMETTDEQFLKNSEWIGLTSEICVVVQKMEGELSSVSEDSPLIYTYKSAFTKLIKHLDFVSNTEACRASWFRYEKPFSLGYRMEVEIISSSPFVFDKTNKFLTNLKFPFELSNEMKSSLTSLRNFFSTYRYSLTDLDVLDHPEWREITKKLRILVVKMKASVDAIDEELIFDFTKA